MSRRICSFIVTEYLLEVRGVVQFDIATHLMYVNAVEPINDTEWFDLDSHRTINEINYIFHHTLILAADRKIINLSQEIKLLTLIIRVVI